MTRQVITRVVDARANQQRVILWLACGHKLSLLIPAQGSPGLEPLPDECAVGRFVTCRFCPDDTPADVRRGRSPTQLWREAGEP